MDDRTLARPFGTTRPTREMVEENEDFWEDLERGQGVYVVLYQDDRPDEILFAGCSFDWRSSQEPGAVGPGPRAD